MLIKFTIENWMCFADSTTFSMEASDEAQHIERVPYIKKYKQRILPITAIFGGNASGKTAFFKALEFIRSMVIEGTPKPSSRIPVDPFRLDGKNEKLPCRFTIELLAGSNSKNETIYELSFSANSKEILEEKLAKKTDKGAEELYVRTNGKINLSQKYKTSEMITAFNNTRDNQLFLQSSINQNRKEFEDVYNWFDYNLAFIYPDRKFSGFHIFKDAGHPISSYVKDALAKLDTGVERLDFKKISFEKIPAPQEILHEIEEQLEEGESLTLSSRGGDDLYIIENKEGILIAQELLTYHKKIKGKHVAFKLKEESDGTKRLINLLPVFFRLAQKKSQQIFIVDELERSLHTRLAEALLEFYAQELSTNNRSQLIFTTHDAILMSQHIFRRDEIWLAERNSDNKSKLYSLSDIEGIDDDTDIAGDYLIGAYGGTPRLSLLG